MGPVPISIKQAADLKGVVASSIRAILYDEARRGEIFPSAVFTGTPRRGEWALSRAEVEAWQPRRPLAKLVKAFVPPTGDPEFSLLSKPLRKRQYTARAENADGSLVVFLTGAVVDDAQIKVIAQAAWLWSIEG